MTSPGIPEIMTEQKKLNESLIARGVPHQVLASIALGSGLKALKDAGVPREQMLEACGALWPGSPAVPAMPDLAAISQSALEQKAELDRATQELVAAAKAEIIKSAELEVQAMRSSHDNACALVASMHEAAMGKVCEPVRGPVEDVIDLRVERDELRAERDVLKAQLEEMLTAPAPVKTAPAAKSSKTIDV